MPSRLRISEIASAVFTGRSFAGLGSLASSSLARQFVCATLVRVPVLRDAFPACGRQAMERTVAKPWMIYGANGYTAN